MKSRLQLEAEVMELIRGRDMSKVREFLIKHYQVDRFDRLTTEELDDFLRRVKR